MARESPSFTRDFKEFFGRGLAVLLPSVLTLWILWQAFTFVFNNVAAPINAGLRRVVVWVVPTVLPESSQPAWFRVTDEQIALYRETLRGTFRQSMSDAQARAEVRRLNLQNLWDDYWYLEGTGLVVAIVLIYLAGLLLGGLIGRRLYTRVEGLIAKVPGFKQVYPHVKQLVDMVIGEKPLAFKRVVLVQYPREGIWTMGLVTGPAMRTVSEKAGRTTLTVFVPSTPTPFTGFTMHVPEDEIVDLPISIDEAVRFLLTGGVLIPDHQLPRGRSGGEVGASASPGEGVGTGPGVGA